MYHLIKAVCLSRSIGSQWREIDLAQILVYDIYATYTKVFLELSNDVLSENVYVDFDCLRSEFSSYNGTLTQLLVQLGNRTLPTVQQLSSTQIKFAKYSDAIRSQYKIELTKIGVNVPDNYPRSELHDLVLTRPAYQTDLSLIHSHCLVTVNGYVHMTDTDGEKAFVYKGGDSLKKSNQQQVGILSFLDIGELTKIPLKPENIHSQSVDSTLKERIYITVDTDVENKTPILVLGGYLIFPGDNVFWRSGQNTFALDINNLPFVERLYESSMYLDLSALQLTEDAINPDMINTEELFSDAVLTRYLTLSQSFLVLVDTPNLATNKIFLRHSSLPGLFTAYQDPVYPLVVNYGKLVEYWKVLEDGHWSVTVQDSFVRNYILSEQPIGVLPNVNNRLRPQTPFHHSRGYLLEISGWH